MSELGGVESSRYNAELFLESMGLAQDPAAKKVLDQEFLKTIDDFLNISGDGLKPVLATPARGAMNLDVLVKALGDDERNIAVKNGLASLDDRKKEMAETAEKKLKEIKTRLETAEKKAALSFFQKLTKWIGLIAGVVGAVATTVVGFASLNPLVATAGVMMAIMAINSIVSEATDGKVSIAAGISNALQRLGVDEKIAGIVGQVFTVAVVVVAAVMTMGAGAFGWGSNLAANTVSATGMSLTNLGHGLSSVATAISGLNSIISGSVNIYSSTLDRDIGYSLANTKELEAIMEKVQAAMEVEKDFLKATMEKYRNITEKVMDLIDSNDQAQTAILSGDGVSSPAMA
jgi:hypothetical protein